MSQTFPKLDNYKILYDLSFLTELSKAVEANPLEDVVYHLPSSTYDNGLNKPWYGSCLFGDIKQHEGIPNCVLAGSAALYLIWNKLYEHHHSKEPVKCSQCEHCKRLDPVKKPPLFSQPNDYDLFFIGSKKAHRNTLGNLDFVYCPEKTVEELLLNFDLGCCRVAMNPANDLWISAHALSAIFTGTYYLPAYLRNETTFTETLTKYTTDSKSTTKNVHSYLYGRLTERLHKYKDRGLTVKWVESDKILPWVQNRFCYATLKEEEAKNKEKLV